MRRWSMIVLVCWLATACGLSEKQRKELAAALDRGLAAAKKLEGQRAAGTKAFFGAETVPNKRCTEAVLFGHPYAIKSGYGNRRVLLASQMKNWNVSVTERSKIPTLKGKRWRAIEKDTKLLRSQITGEGLPAGAQRIDNERGLKYGHERAKKIGDPSWYRYEIIYATLKVEVELAYKGKKYPSFIRGRAMVWDYEAGKVICSGQDEGRPQGRVKIYYRRSEGVKDSDMIYALKTGLRDEIFQGALWRAGLGMGPSKK